MANVKQRLDELTAKKARIAKVDENNLSEADHKALSSSQERVKNEQVQEAEEYKKSKPQAVVYPTTWDLSDDSFKLVPVTVHSPEGIEVYSRFYRNDAKSRQVFDMKSIFRIQNMALYDHYQIKKHSISKKNGNEANEKQLFHGCASRAIESITENGFDLRLSSFKGAAGVGIYFAKFPRTSLSYIRDCPPSEMKIILCRVLLGAATSIPDLHQSFPASSPANPIRHPQARSETDRTPFDSVFGNMRDDPNHPIHVVYDNYQIYPEYLITFSIKENRIVRGRPPTVAAIINYTHPRYLAQLEETKKSLKFLERSINYEPNRNKSDYPMLQKFYTLLTTNPQDATSIHQTENFDLSRLQGLVRHYNQLCANYPILLLPEPTSPVPLVLNENIAIEVVEPKQEVKQEAKQEDKQEVKEEIDTKK